MSYDGEERRVTDPRELTQGVERANHLLRVLAAMVAVAVMVVLAVILVVTIRSQQDVLDLIADAKAAESRRAVAETARREDNARAVASALSDIERIITEQIAGHDADARATHDALLGRIAQLLGRPAGVPLDPVTARPAQRTTPPTVAPAPATTVAPTRAMPRTTPTTCAKRCK